MQVGVFRVLVLCVFVCLLRVLVLRGFVCVFACVLWCVLWCVFCVRALHACFSVCFACVLCMCVLCVPLLIITSLHLTHHFPPSSITSLPSPKILFRPLTITFLHHPSNYSLHHPPNTLPTPSQHPPNTLPPSSHHLSLSFSLSHT